MVSGWPFSPRRSSVEGSVGQRSDPSGPGGMLGIYRETVSQIIGEFRDRGLVIPGRRRIRVLDQEGLMRVAEQVG